MANIKQVYWSANKGKYMCKMLNQNDLCMGPDYMEETLLYLGIYSWYTINTTNSINILSTPDN